MKRIDVENAITKYLDSNKFTIIDSLSNQYTISSYEQYIECFALIKNTYQNSITEFYEEGQKYIDLINEFITNVIENENSASIEQYISNNLRSSLEFSYNRTVNLISIYPRHI